MPIRYARLRILVVEDHPFQRAAAEGLLRHVGVLTLASAQNGTQAAELLAREPFDVVLCDIEMPGCNGPELIAELHRRGPHAFAGAPPVWVWVTALAEDILDSNRGLAHAAGIPRVHALRKPLSRDALEVILADALVRRDAAAGIPAWSPGDEELLAATRAGTDLLVMLQPQYDIASGRLAGAEALVRWRHPEHGLVAPDQFIPQLEALDAADPVFFLVARQCLAALQRLRAAGVGIAMGLNASAQTLCRPGVLESFDALVGASGVPRQALTVELTEGYPVPDTLALSVALNRLRLLGYGVAIDDFGVGIATLKLLADLPFTQLKVDRSFVAEVDGHGQRATICRSMIALARELGLECVAEGVETDAQRAALLALGCPLGQGYLWSAPKPAEAFVADAIERAAAPPPA
ncbi:EAL domain-containing protein [Cupriavidus taiwanensis]|uniref:Response regulator receiver (CheY-like) diguanylate phosphodiesterase (EAL domain) n=1 Tax=Cupriavidus taiwanensis (strain DSM 17343 / BCRC 17206 / CCUG 44338 / CIP 107171 / LMG 19424 / R1) TaxID=977880 RepID=B3R146_CUPTR|nr:EAL domain-containing protein [Cupriavidus taiwanensis]CAQ69456.1 putative response regulator receiver (CheY-like) diguanylate phosphodiesterase (EAL domain) [Cupriavidus taiwanensis LMG 19424]